MKGGRLAGHYFNVLGVGSLTWMVVGPIFGHSLLLDFGFILYFWTGFGLLNRRKGARTVALVILTLGFLFCIGFLISLLWADGPVSSRGELRTPLLAAAHAAILMLVFLPPFILLLLPETRRWFVEDSDPPTRFTLTSRLIGVYVLISLVLDAGGVMLHRAVGTVESKGWSTSFSYGSGKVGTTATGWLEDKATGRPLFVTWLAFGESDTMGRGDGYVSFGAHRIELPQDKPIRYLRFFPEEKDRGGNVIIVRKDGTVIRLARRVTHDQLWAARDAVDGATDFDDVRRRLEAFLPSAEVAAK